jgi:hypothetical protein
MALLRVRDIIAFAPILSELSIRSDCLTEREFLHHAKLWRRKSTSPIALIDVDARTRELQEAVNAFPIVEPDLTTDETIALFTLLYESRKELPDVWPAFCESMKNPCGITFGLGQYYLCLWTGETVPYQPPAELDRLFADIMPPPLLVNMYQKCVGHKFATYSWPSLAEFNKAFRNVFLQWRGSTIECDGVRLDPSHTEVIPFPVGWGPIETKILKKLNY